MPPRMTANPVRPARHRPGKAAPESESSSSEDEVEVPEKKPERRVRAPPKVASAPVVKDEAREKAEREAMEKMAAEAGFVTESEAASEGEEEEEEESDEESEEESEESESEEERPRLMLRPKFIPKSQRGKSEQEREAEEREREEERRREDADALVEEQIKRDVEARAAGRKHWEDSESEPEEGDELDDADGVDPEAELAAFRLRKLKRYKRDREAMLAREREIEELERRRNLTEEERRAEDEEKIRKQEEERGEKGQMGFMRKYFHKGAFYQEEAEEAGLLDRDLAGARFEDEVGREKLPEYLQRRDMTKIGKKGATRYKDLRSEDTGTWGDFDGRKGGRWDGDERFRPDDGFRGGGAGGGEYGAQGANAIPLGRAPGRAGGEDREDRYGGERDGKERERGHGRGGRSERGEHRDRETSRDRGGRRDGDRERERSRDRYRERERSRDGRHRRNPSRSRSPRERHRRKRSTSPDDRHDKRRRVDSR